MAVASEVKLFGKWSFEDVEVGSDLLPTALPLLSGVLSTSVSKHMLTIAGKRYITGGLYCGQAKIRCLRAAHCGPVSEEAVPQGAVPHR